MKERVKNTKGITLIALVVTIIILLILAGVTINVVLGENGLFKRAKEAIEINNEEQAKEKIELALASFELAKEEDPDNFNEETLDNFIERETGAVIVSEGEYLIDGYIIEVDKNKGKVIGSRKDNEPRIEVESITIMDNLSEIVIGQVGKIGNDKY